MCISIAFEKVARTPLKMAVKAFAGPYVHTEMVVSTESEGCKRNSAFTSQNFSAQSFDKKHINDRTFDFLLIPATPEEEVCIRTTLEACTRSRIPYNTRDMILSQVPFRQPVDKSLFEAAGSCGLYCAQAMVAVLRECLMPPNPLLAALSEINSRTVTPTELFMVLSKHCRTISAIATMLPKSDVRNVKVMLQSLWLSGEN
jgi:hypothetical protein